MVNRDKYKAWLAGFACLEKGVSLLVVPPAALSHGTVRHPLIRCFKSGSSLMRPISSLTICLTSSLMR